MYHFTVVIKNTRIYVNIKFKNRENWKNTTNTRTCQRSNNHGITGISRED